jgi:3-keto-disaccharide hydrolase
MFRYPLAILGLLLSLCGSSVAAAADENFRPLFNGKDLSGWVIVNVAPSTFSVRDGMIVSTGKPTGTMRTERMYENFIMEVEWRHMKAGGNAGVFIWGDPLTHVGQPFSRGIEVQVLDGRETKDYTSDGDVFSIWGASMKPDRPHPSGWERCLPSEKRCHPSPEWNHYRITCNDGVLKLAVNGKEVSGGSLCRPRKGYICLESEGSECHFRNLKIQELPSTNPSPAETADQAQGFVPMYTGLDLSGWRNVTGQEGHWQPKDWILHYDGKSEAAEAKDKHLWTAKEYGDFQMIVDWRFPAKPVKKKYPVVLPNGDDKLDEKGEIVMREVDDAGNSGILLRGNEDAQLNICCYPVGSGEITAFRTNKQLPAAVRAAVTPKEVADARLGQWNRFIITLKGDRVSVVFNNKPIIENAQLPGIPSRGPIGLQHHNEVVEFSNLFIREL